MVGENRAGPSGIGERTPLPSLLSALAVSVDDNTRQGVVVSAQALLAALSMGEGAWQAAEAERETQRLRRAYLDKWEPVWALWGHRMPGEESCPTG